MSEQRSSRGLRREPVQARSKARVEAILAAASELLAEGGAETLVLREVSRRSGVPIGSIYQYFPDKAGILHTLVQRYHRRSQELLREHLQQARDLESFGQGLGAMVDAYFALHRDEPLWREVLGGMLADKELAQLNLRDSQAVGAILAEALVRCAPQADPQQVGVSCELVAHLIAGAMQVALAEPDPRRQQALFEAFKQMAGAQLEQVAG